LLVATTTGYQTRSFGEAAEKLGVRLVFATDRCDRIEDPWWDQAVPIRFHDEERSTAAILEAVNGTPVHGVLAVGDRPTVIAALAARALGLPGNSPAAACASRNKLASRMALRTAGLPVPWFQPVPADRDARSLAEQVPYPCIVKPLAMSGSRGVIRANSREEFLAAFGRVVALLRQADVRLERDAAHDMLMIESFIPGREYALEGLLDRGALQTLALFDKPDPLDGPFFEETIYVVPSELPRDDQARISDAVARAAGALGLTHGPVHAEVRVNADGIFVLEVAARPIGGLCSRALRFAVAAGLAGGEAPASAAAMSLEELLLRHVVGEDVTHATREAIASGVMMIPIPARGIYRAVSGVEDARGVAGIDDVRITAKQDQMLVPLPEGKSYLGFIFARAGRAADVVRALRGAHAYLHFKIDREVPVVGRT
jgi:phosphoribosylaminoimidazole carboxylase (NCAIR synthetase)